MISETFPMMRSGSSEESYSCIADSGGPAAQAERAVNRDCAGHLGKAGIFEREISCAPEGSNLGLGCGNPLAFAALNQESGMDLGSGGGFDAFLAAGR